MKKRKIVRIVLNNNNTANTPSQEALEEAAMHFTLDVQNAGSSQEGQL